mmetsp:Transcript_14026/g.33367  ORF Transcript_14026/g.33367 Transcript_14026/m.33367 type:complete len:220 (-) Transcript_14026:1130-1789(-)
MGVTNSFKKPGILRSEGNQCWIKLMIRPLMCEPSWSWSVMIMMEPYLRPLASRYSLLASKAKIFRTWSISLFSSICFTESSRTLRSLPRSGKTPKRSRPTTDSPATASALAESPSVRISVQLWPSLVPARLASSSFGTPKSRFWRPRSLRFRCCASSLLPMAFAQSWRASSSPLSTTSCRSSSGRWQLEPNLSRLLVRVSLVCESKAGFSTRQFTKIQR